MMRRKDRQITDPARIREIFAESIVCRVAFCDESGPYIVPLSFGVHYNENGEADRLYFHGAAEGRKMTLLSKNPVVSFELDKALNVKQAETACGYSMRYQSIIGTGTARLLTDFADKRAALDCIMAHYTPGQSWTYPDAMLAQTVAWCIEIQTICCKANA